jgi:hypothetical protein
MIYLTQNNSTINVEWQYIENLEGFTNTLVCNPNEIEVDVIGQYNLINKIQCGLKCNTWHNNGFIIRTKQNQITNVGRDCGAKYFGGEFKLQSQQMKRSVDRNINQRIVDSFINDIPTHRESIQDIALKINKGWGWFLELKKLLFNEEFTPNVIISSINRCLETRSSDLMTSDLKKPVRVGFLNGLKAFYPENDITELIRVDMLIQLKILEQKNPFDLKDMELNKWSKWVDEYQTNINKAQEIVKSGRGFFSNKNLIQFRNIFDSRNVSRYNKWIIEIEKEDEKLCKLTLETVE